MELDEKEGRCLGKKCFSSKAMAIKRVLEIRDEEYKNEKEDCGTIPLRAYKCEKCRMWHLTSIPAKKWKEAKRAYRKRKTLNNPFSLEVQYWKEKFSGKASKR